ncbi:MAG TPA: uroporphyrinogen-III C-methyltransferase [Gammaproteobacteria bacterium]|jgi:uroporphyrin-3 C-methyltransferase
MSDTEIMADSAPAKAPGRPRSNALLALTATFALVLAVLATTIAGFLWWQYREFYVALDTADEHTAARLDTVRGDIGRVDERLDAVNALLETNRARTTELGDRVEVLPGQLTVLEERIAAAQGGSLEARTAWLHAEAEYHLALANSELVLAGRWESAITALERADRALAELGNPAFRSVRDAIAGELIELRAVTLPDVEGLAFALGRLEQQAASLPLRFGNPTQAATPVAAVDAEPGLGRLWQSIEEALAGIIRVERRDEPVAHVLSVEEGRLVRKQLELELKLARMAALGGEGQAFQASLGTAIDLLRREFDATAADVEGARVLLEQMRALDIAPPRPDISRSLTLLRAIPAGGG